MNNTVTTVLLTALLLAPLGALHAADMGRYNVIWNSPSEDASGVMPLGNGDIAAGVYAIENGDLYLLLSKNDAFNYMGDIYKTGRVRVALDPNPFTSGKPFCQTLDLPTGSIQIEAGGVRVRVWADALRPVYHVEIGSPHELTVNVQPEFWRNRHDVKLERAGQLIWYYTVGDRSVYTNDLKYYEVEHMADKFPDPYRLNTFGNLMEMKSESRIQKLEGFALEGKGKQFDILIHSLTLQTPNPETWVETLERQAAQPVNAASDWEKHCAWWTNFWNRSWVIASDNTVPAGDREKFNGEPSAAGFREEADGAAVVAQNYNVFRFLMACQSRGRIQTKFNGGLFTQPLRGKPGVPLQLREDGRLWGRRFTYQNQRLLYWPMLANGDFDLMKPFFDYYSNLLPMRQAITKAWFGHDGAYYRENIEPTGAERDCGKDGRPPKTNPGDTYAGGYHDYYFTSGLETTAMMLDYVNFTGDTGFRDRVLVPFAQEVLLFFDKHYARGADGKLRLAPAQVLETYWVAVNSAPDVAGLRFCLDELLTMKAGTAEDQARWRKFRAEIPEVFLRTVKGRQAIAPAEIYGKKSNAENGELYPVFPFRLFGLALGTGDLVEWTMQNRTSKNAFDGRCWTQDQIHWAYAGNAAEAAAGLVHRFRIASPACRFPMYGRQMPDSCPDFDHFGSGSVALQRMLVQESGNKILLLPAWLSTWDVDFKLHLSQGAVLTGTVKDGKLATWAIQPSCRNKDVVICPLQHPKPNTKTR